MAYTMQQAVNSELAFNPLSAPDGQGEVFVGKNQNTLQEALKENGWEDLRFVTKDQIAKAGWTLADNAVPVQITFRNEANAAKWDNKVLYNASQVIGMPSQEEMLEVARARLVPVVEKAPQAVADPAIDERLILSPSQVREHALWSGLSDDERRKLEEQARLDELAAQGHQAVEEDLVVGPGKRRVLDEEEEIAVAPVFREQEKGAGEQQVTAPVLDYAVPVLLGTKFKERVVGSGEYVREGEKKTAFLDKGGSLVIRDKQQDTYQAVMGLAKSKGWAEIELTGKPESIAKGWLEAQMLGIKVANYVPTEKDLAALDERRAEVERLRTGVVPEKAGQPVEKAAVGNEPPPSGARVVNSGFYVGPVVDVVDGYAIQRDGPGKLVAHKLSNFEVPPQVGGPVDIQYKGGRASVMEPRAKSQEVGGGREIGGR